MSVYWARGFDLAVENGQWRGAVVFVFEQNGWTVFEDWAGYLVDRSGQDWLRLAGDDALVYAGYNDSIPAGWLVMVHQGKLIHEFLDDAQDPSANRDFGRLEIESEAPIQSWMEAASFVDGDELAVSPDYGTLWMFQGV